MSFSQIYLKNEEIKKFDLLNILIVSRNIDFIDYLCGGVIEK
ncbi:conserved hypothetical protein [Aliarcobacter butzleri JV22]|nr:conserved hypothetical protein [Aliarcobacter butzleri JV22]